MPAQLTKREKQIAILLSQGKRVPEIADQLDISRYTVDVHKTNAYRKLDIHRLADLTRYVIQVGWLEP